MPLAPAFTTSQSIGFPSRINLADESTGSDVNITGRKVYVATPAGSFLVEEGNTNEYSTWSYANSTITLDLLGLTDKAVRLVV